MDLHHVTADQLFHELTRSIRTFELTHRCGTAQLDRILNWSFYETRRSRRLEIRNHKDCMSRSSDRLEELREEMNLLKARLCWRRDIPLDIRTRWMGDHLMPHARAIAEMVCIEFRDSVRRARTIPGLCGGKMPLCITAAAERTVVCTQTGVFVCGKSWNGEHSVPTRSYPLPGETVMSVATSPSDTVLCTLSGRGFTVREASDRRTDLMRVEELRPAETAVAAVAAGACHNLLLTAQGKVYGHGSTLDGKLGHVTEPYIHVPRLLEALGTKAVVAVAAGEEHTVVCTDQGEVYTFGSDHAGQLGRGDLMPYDVPCLVEGLVGTRVVAVAAGASHTVVLSSQGELYTFGEGYWGQLGQGDGKNRHTPCLVESLVGEECVATGCSAQDTSVCTAEGALYTFGRSNCSSSYDNFPCLVRNLVGRHVTGVSTGCTGEHSAFWTDDGQVYTWGQINWGGSYLGHGDAEYRDTPRAVSFNYECPSRGLC
jgi:hypothetical protein